MEQALTDEQVINCLYEYSKIDSTALKLMAELQNTKEFGERDMVLGKIYHYVRNHPLCMN